MDKHITNMEISEGEELYELIEPLPEDVRQQILIYVRALSDRCMISSSKKAG